MSSTILTHAKPGSKVHASPTALDMETFCGRQVVDFDPTRMTAPKTASAALEVVTCERCTKAVSAIETEEYDAWMHKTVFFEGRFWIVSGAGGDAIDSETLSLGLAKHHDLCKIVHWVDQSQVERGSDREHELCTRIVELHRQGTKLNGIQADLERVIRHLGKIQGSDAVHHADEARDGVLDTLNQISEELKVLKAELALHVNWHNTPCDCGRVDREHSAGSVDGCRFGFPISRGWH